jgi:hypothetical protein
LRAVKLGMRDRSDSARPTVAAPDERRARAWKVSRFSLGAMIAGLAFIAMAQRTEFRSTLAAVRDAFLIHYTADASMVYRPPYRLIEEGFRVDSPEARAAWRSRVERVPGVPHALDSIGRQSDELERGFALARLLTSGDAGAPSVCGGVGDLEDLLRFVAQGGMVCCSDYTAAFLSLAPQVGLMAREVRIAVPHGVVEIYSERNGRWVMIDPLFNMVARGNEGTPLSTWELQRALRQRQSVSYDFFGRDPAGARPDRNRLAFDSIYGERFEHAELSTPMGNNVISYDDFRRPLAFLPKAVVQAMSLQAGVFPAIVAVSENRDELWAATLRATLVRILVVFVTVSLGLGMLAGPVVSLSQQIGFRIRPFQVTTRT